MQFLIIIQYFQNEVIIINYFNLYYYQFKFTIVKIIIESVIIIQLNDFSLIIITIVKFIMFKIIINFNFVNLGVNFNFNLIWFDDDNDDDAYDEGDDANVFLKVYANSINLNQNLKLIAKFINVNCYEYVMLHYSLVKCFLIIINDDDFQKSIALLINAHPAKFNFDFILFL